MKPSCQNEFNVDCTNILFCTEIGLTQTTMTSSIHEEEAGEGAIGTEKKK